MRTRSVKKGLETDPPQAERISGKSRVRHRELALARGAMTSDAFAAFLEAALRAPLAHLQDGALLSRPHHAARHHRSAALPEPFVTSTAFP